LETLGKNWKGVVELGVGTLDVDQLEVALPEPLLGVETGDVVGQEHSWEGVEKIGEDELVLAGGIVLVEGIDDEQLQKGEPLLGVETGDVVVQEHSWEGVEKIAEDELLLGFEDSVEEGIGKIDDVMVNDGNNERKEECILLEIVEEETDNKSDGNNQKKEEYVLLEVEKKDDDENEDNIEDNFVDDGQKEVYVHWELDTKDDVEDNFVDNNQMEEYVQLDVEKNDYVEDEDNFVDDFGNENDFEDVDGFVVGREELVAGSTLKRQRQELEDLVHLIVNLLYRFILQVIFIINVLNYFISNFLFINVYFANARINILWNFVFFIFIQIIFT